MAPSSAGETRQLFYLHCPQRSLPEEGLPTKCQTYRGFGQPKDDVTAHELGFLHHPIRVMGRLSSWV